MNRNIVIHNGYSVGLAEQPVSFIIPSKYAGEQLSRCEKRDFSEINITESLNGDIDIFTEIPETLYKEKDVALFLKSMREAIVEENPQNVTLSKLIVTEETETGCTLDWIFNYFRLYFSFDKIDGDYFGLMSHDIEKKSYKNEFNFMEPQNFKSIAKSVLSYVLFRIQG